MNSAPTRSEHVFDATTAGFETDVTRTKIITNLLSLAKDFGCDLILEGIEERSTAAKATDLGIRYGQGFLFGKPAETF